MEQMEIFNRNPLIILTEHNVILNTNGKRDVLTMGKLNSEIEKHNIGIVLVLDEQLGWLVYTDSGECIPYHDNMSFTR